MATARNTLAVAIKLDGTAQAKKDLEDFASTGEKAFERLAAAANKVAPGLGDKLQTALRSIRTQFIALQAAGARFAKSFSTFATAVKTVGVAAQNSAKKIGLITAAVTGAAGAALLLAKRSADNAEHIVGQAEALGISAQAYQTFQDAVTSAGLGQEEFDQILGKFVTTAAEGSASAEDTAKAFRQVEVTLADGSKSMITVRGTSDALAKSLTDTAQSFRQVEVTAADGSKQMITVRGTSEQLAKSLSGLGKGGESGLIAFAKKIEGLKTAQERLNAVVEFGFAKRAAPAVVRAMLAIARDADPAARAISKTLEPLSDPELGGLLEIDTAFDRLGTNLSRIKDQIVAIFGPAVSELINGIADAIFNNQRAIRAFAKDVADKALVVVRDLMALLRGDDAAVQNKGLITFRDALVRIGTTVQRVVFDIIIPGFTQVMAILDQVAAVINGVFGTSFSGEGLAITAVILQVTGAFQLLLSVLALGAAALQLLGGGINLIVLALRPLAFALGFVGAALASILGLPAAVGVAIVAAIAIATAATIVYWDEIKAGAAEAWGFAKDKAGEYATAVGTFLGPDGGLDQAWESIKQGATDAWNFAAQEAQKFAENLKAFLANPGDFFASWATSFENFFSDMIGRAKSFGADLLSAIGGAIRSIIGLVNDAISAFKRLFSAQSSSGNSSNNSGFKATALSRAGGGPIRGPGTATSDSIPIWASDGEFMVRARAAAKVGLGFLRLINSGRYDLGQIFEALQARGYALGGAIGGLEPALAGGLSVSLPRLSLGGLGNRPSSNLQPVTFVLDGQRVDGFQAAPGAVGELMKASAHKRVRSNGRKPGWYGGPI